MKDLAIISYLTNKIGPLYQTKLYKLLFYVDFLYYKHHNSSITWCTYYKLPYWPVPLAIKTKVDCIINNSDIEDEEIKKDIWIYKKYLDINKSKEDKKCTIIWKFSEEKMLTEEEIAVMDYVIEKLGSFGTSKIVSKSHSEKAYIMTAMFQPIFYGFSNSLNI